jgi:predicted O-methyltransferase YrrM
VIERWTAVDHYTAGLLLDPDPALEEAVTASAAAGLPAIAVSPNQGKLLALLVRLHGSRRVLELGTLGGYSTIWLARALPDDGLVLTLELQAAYAEVARANLERAGLAGRVELRVGPALEGLEQLLAEHADPFDFIFIDADKAGTPEYFELALELSREGTVILTDNVVRGGALIDPDTDDAGALGMRRFQEMLAEDRRGPRRVSATTIQMVGSKGWDGFTLALVERPPERGAAI